MPAAIDKHFVFAIAPMENMISFLLRSILMKRSLFH